MASASKHLLAVSLAIVGIIHMMPVAGVFGVERLNVLYGLSIDDPNLAILMRHRAVLFGLLGVFCLVAAARQSLQLIALVAGAISVFSFLVLTYATGGYNDEVGRVVTADWIAAAFLIIGFAAYRLRAKATTTAQSPS